MGAYYKQPHRGAFQMKRKIIRFVSFFLILVSTSAGLWAKSKPRKPRSNEVVLIAKIRVTPGIDFAFWSKYAHVKSPVLSWGGTKSAESDEAMLNPPVYAVVRKHISQDSSKKPVWVRRTEIWICTLNSFGGAYYDIPKDRTIVIDHFSVYLNGFDPLRFDLPVKRMIVVPEGVNYLYLGTFTYNLKNEYFEIDMDNSGVKDEFDSAQSFISEFFGDDVELRRAPLKPIDDADYVHSY